MNNKEKKIKMPKFLSFPNKLNNGTMLGLIFVYLVIIFAVAIIAIPNFNYTSVPEYSHKMGSENISAYLKLKTNLSIDNDGNITPKQSVTSYIYKGLSDEDYQIHYDISGLTKNDTMDYMYSGSRATYTDAPIIHTVKSEASVDGNGYKTLFAKINYYKELEDETKGQEYYYTFAEPVINLSKKEANQEESIKKSLQDKFSFNVRFTASTEANLYNAYTTVSIKSEELKYHLDYQSFIMTEDGEIYPLLGFYNVTRHSQSILTDTLSINNKIKIAYVIVKATYTNSAGVSESIFYKEKVTIK